MFPVGMRAKTPWLDPAWKETRSRKKMCVRLSPEWVVSRLFLIAPTWKPDPVCEGWKISRGNTLTHARGNTAKNKAAADTCHMRRASDGGGTDTKILSSVDLLWWPLLTGIFLPPCLN
jgi:hypothetical protein